VTNKSKYSLPKPIEPTVEPSEKVEPTEKAEEGRTDDEALCTGQAGA
jgi:hypothetical protein